MYFKNFNVNMSRWLSFGRRYWSCSKIPALKQQHRTASKYICLARHHFAIRPPKSGICCRFMSNESNKLDNRQSGNEHKDLKSPVDDDDSSKKTSRQRLSLAFAKYGATAVVFHTAISLTSLGLCYIAVSSGLDIPGFLIKMGFSESLSTSIAAKGASTFVIAYACHKIFMPLRIFLTVTCTPLIVLRLQRLGILKAKS